MKRILIMLSLMAFAFILPENRAFAQTQETDQDAVSEAANEAVSDAIDNATLTLGTEDELDDQDEIENAAYITDAMMTTNQKLLELVIRFFVNLIAGWIIVGAFYYRKSRRRDYYFTFMTFSSAMLLLLYVMGNVEVGIGLTLGLFAIFGVIRYRTETVPIREMTYLFVIIALAAVNGLAPLFSITDLHTPGVQPHYELQTGGILILVIANLLMILLIYIFESYRLVKQVSAKLVLYDRIDLIVPEKREELIKDLEARVGIKIDHLEIGHVDFLKDAAFIKCYYTLDKNQGNSIDTLTKAKDYTG